jgi:peptidoglycan-N-acetylglucosamine deacetylase
MYGYLIAAAAAATASAAGYQSMAPAGQWYGQTFTGLPPGSPQLALTFDDGPNDPHTLRLLEVLAKHGVPATFFVIGRYLQQRPDIVREVVKAGHIIGNHTYDHPNLIFTSRNETNQQLKRCDDALYDATGVRSRLFRPPFGRRRPGSLQAARAMGLAPVMWSVSGRDWKGRPAEYIEQNVRRQIRGGNVILLHDGSHLSFGADRSRTVIATDRLIASHKSQGYKFVTIPEMMQKAGVKL